MSIKFKVRQGGASASQPDLANLAEAREGVPVFSSDGTPLIDMAQRWEMGQAGQGFYTYVDVDGSLSYFHRPHAEVKLIEDESGTDYIIGWGRMEGGNDVARPTASASGGPGHGTVEHNSIQVMDCNIDLRGLPFRTAWERPAETTWQRLQALELRSLNGSSSTGDVHRATTDITVNNFTGGNHLVDASDPVDMEAHTYPAGSMVTDVMEDIFSQWEGKRWGVTIHHTDSGSHKCLLVLDPDDNETFQSELKISDHLEDWNPDDPDAPVLPPEWRRGAGKISDNTDVVSGVISIYGGTNDNPRHTYVETGDPEDEWETWVDVYNDDIAKNVTQAERRANKILADRKRPYITPQPSITLNPDQVTLITAGQSIEVKSVVINQGPDRAEYQWWRIAEIRWEPLPDGRWRAHLELGRAKNARGANGGGGPGQPGSTSPKPAPECPPDIPDSTAIDWDWEPCSNPSYLDPYLGGTSNPWGSGFETIPGGADGCGTPTNNNVYSDYIAVTPADVLAVHWWSAKYGSGPLALTNFRIRYYDSGGSQIEQHDNSVYIGTSSHEHGTTVTENVIYSTVPASAAYMRMAQTTYSLVHTQHVQVIILGEEVTGDDFCIDYGDTDHDSPNYLPSDYAEAKFAELQAQIDALPEHVRDIISWKEPVVAATTAAGTLATSFENGDTIDGVTLATGDRILIKNQATGAENGIYVVAASGTPTRAEGFTEEADVLGAAVIVMEGTTNADTVWLLTTNEPITIDSTSLSFSQMGGGSPSGSAGGDLSGTYPNPSVVDDSHSHTGSTLSINAVGELLIVDTGASTPLIFADILQNEAQDDLVYADI